MIHNPNAYRLPYIITCRIVHNCSLMSWLWSWHSNGMGSQNLRPRCVLAFTLGHMVILREVHDAWKSALTVYVQISASCSYKKKSEEKISQYHASFVCARFWKGRGCWQTTNFCFEINIDFYKWPLSEMLLLVILRRLGNDNSSERRCKVTFVQHKGAVTSSVSIRFLDAMGN